MAITKDMPEDSERPRSAKRCSFVWRLVATLGLITALGSAWLIVMLCVFPPPKAHNSLSRRQYEDYVPMNTVPIVQQLDQNADGVPDQPIVWTIPTGPYESEDLLDPTNNDTKTVHITQIGKRDDRHSRSSTGNENDTQNKEYQPLESLIPRSFSANMVQCSECDINPHGNCNLQRTTRGAETDEVKLRGRCQTYAQLCHSMNGNLRQEYEADLEVAADMNEDGSVWIFNCGSTSFYRTENR